ncbi:MAG TPA: hypothetical protein DEB24_08500 [Coriobacteriia bacterium]|nr:hypothetical protein [Coriobacteriia bacterium]
MTERFGQQGIIAFIAQYVYYTFEGGLFLAIIVFGQKFGELVFKNHKIPWGGILCGLTWGLGHIFTQDMLTGITAVTSAVFFGLAYLLLKKNIRFAYPIITLIFMV